MEELEFPRSDLPAGVVFVGELTRPRAGDVPLPPWWHEVETSDSRIVLVTQGTLNVDPRDLIEPTVAALGRQEVLLVATTGKAEQHALRTGTPTARAVLRAWRRVTSDASYRANAERIAARLAKHDGPREVVEHTMRLLGVGPT